jgi:hypothetical protein
MKGRIQGKSQGREHDPKTICGVARERGSQLAPARAAIHPLVALGGGLAAAACLTGCAPSSGSHLLSPLSSTQDDQIISQLQSRNPGSLCAVVTKDGQARLMSFGQQAVVDVDGRPTALSYHPGQSGKEASFTGAAISVSGDLVPQLVTEFGKTISTKVRVHVVAGARTEDLDAKWVCQAALIRVR